jgi:sugar-phosphatase
MICAEDTPRGKPDPAGYLLAARRLNTPPHECIAVEDAPAGIRAARDAGMFVVAVTNTHPEADLLEAGAIIESLRDLDVILD